ncbi:MAG: bifunctional (p)ppGpp synthetase/guanosine-3',5'-bis(diphosphate) 3'-pyrophosphohydrolase [Candidatus Cloacimonetes bacterium]|nr:bifunctional (p)ppGpp synthetase/guanosine-3',5'-bis(diphosphate) 3'-pyrophosphohydrolase [Candidatus Cloacimonadota bacterium]
MRYDNINPDNFLSQISTINPGIDTRLMGKAFQFTYNAHLGQKRESGDPYIMHPMQVSFILADLGLDSVTLAAGLLHDVLEDTSFKINDLKREFGPEITLLVQGVTKIEKYPYHSSSTRKHLQAENYRKLMISITRDIRVILIKLADRLHNMRTLDYLQDDKRNRIALETLEIYVPLANRFGIAKIQWELEDLSFKTLHHDEYKKIGMMVARKKNERDQYITTCKEKIFYLLHNNNIQAEVEGRSKHFYSIYLKHMIKKIKFEDILDLIGMRIIVNSIADCYKTLSLIQSEFDPLDKSLKDYIQRPKSNNYQSLHVVVSDSNEYKIEIQIRTRQMHVIAEEGIAAHWRYKEFYSCDRKNRKGEVLVAEMQNAFNQQLSWIRNLVREEHHKDSDSFLDSLHLNLYPDIIVVRTPGNDYIELRKNSTPLDFAFKIHSDIGFHCIGACINGKHKPVRTTLKTGDVVSILTSPQAKPSKDWLSIVTSAKTRQKIRAYFTRIELQTAISRGKELLTKKIRKHHLKLKNQDELLHIARVFKINDLKTFYAALGNEEITFSQVVEAWQKTQEGQPKAKAVPEREIEQLVLTMPEITIEEIDHLMVRFAKCCHPEPGCDIIGYTTRGRGITIHRTDCQNHGFLNLMKKEPERIIKVAWKKIPLKSPHG